MRRAVVTGLGVVSPFGAGVKAYWAGLAAGACAIRPLTLFETNGFRCGLAGEVPEAAGGSLRRTRADRLALAAAGEALDDAGLERGERSAAALVVGAVGGGMLEAEAWYWARARGERVPGGVGALRTMLPGSHAAALGHRLRLERATPHRGHRVLVRGGGGGRGRRSRRRRSGGCRPGWRRRCIDPDVFHGVQRAQAARSRAVPAVRSRSPRHVDRRGRGVPRGGGGRARAGPRRADLRRAGRARRDHRCLPRHRAPAGRRGHGAGHAGRARRGGPAARGGGLRERARNRHAAERPDRGAGDLARVRRGPGARQLDQVDDRPHDGGGRQSRGRGHGAGARARSASPDRESGHPRSRGPLRLRARGSLAKRPSSAPSPTRSASAGRTSPCSSSACDDGASQRVVITGVGVVNAAIVGASPALGAWLARPRPAPRTSSPVPAVRLPDATLAALDGRRRSPAALARVPAHDRGGSAGRRRSRSRPPRQSRARPRSDRRHRAGRFHLDDRVRRRLPGPRPGRTVAVAVSQHRDEHDGRDHRDRRADARAVAHAQRSDGGRRAGGRPRGGGGGQRAGRARSWPAASTSSIRSSARCWRCSAIATSGARARRSSCWKTSPPRAVRGAHGPGAHRRHGVALVAGATVGRRTARRARARWPRRSSGPVAGARSGSMPRPAVTPSATRGRRACSPPRWGPRHCRPCRSAPLLGQHAGLGALAGRRGGLDRALRPAARRCRR